MAVALRWAERAVLAGGVIVSLVLFLAVDARSHSASDTLYGLSGPEAFAIAVALAVIGELRVARRRA